MTDEALLTEDPTKPARGLTRRQLAKGAAWSAPVIVLAAAAPAAAASVYPPADSIGVLAVYSSPSVSANQNSLFTFTSYITVDDEEIPGGAMKTGWYVDVVLSPGLVTTGLSVYDTVNLTAPAVTALPDGSTQYRFTIKTLEAPSVYVRVGRPSPVGASVTASAYKSDGTLMGSATATAQA